MISFSTKLGKIGERAIILLPQDASSKLPSRGIVMVRGSLENIDFKVVLEPDGKGSHWFEINSTLLSRLGKKIGDEVDLDIETTDEWIEPELPKDFQTALSSSPTAQQTWYSTSILAHWDWIRWIQAVKTSETRRKHILVALSKLNKGLKRPCCFNRSLCSDPTVSHNWKLRI